MGDYPFRGDGQIVRDYGKNLATTALTQLTAPVVDNQKGAWLEIVSSLAINAKALLIHFTPSTQTSRLYLVDFAVGASGSEQIFLNNLFVTIAATATPAIAHFPISIPAGSRISARYQADTAASSNVRVAITALSTGFFTASPYSRIVTIGANTATSGGTTISPGNGVKGSYAQLTASLANDMSALLIAIGNVGFVQTQVAYQMDISVGSSGFETVLIPDLGVVDDNGTDSFQPKIIGPLPINIKAGTRIAVRGRTTTAGTSVGMVLYGLS